MISKEFEAQIREEAQADYPLEACWLITKDGCQKVDNIHDTPETHFTVSRFDVMAAMHVGLIAVVHSHPDGHAVPSESDMQSQMGSDVPWGVLSCNAESAGPINWWGTEERAPLIGRRFKHGITDCYALIRDYYKVELGIDLPEYPRDWMWWNKGQDLFADGFSKAGFTPISASDVQPGDVWLATIRSPVINHGGIYLGNNLMLHQICSSKHPIDDSRISAREPMGRYLQFVTHWLRYTG